MKVFNSVSGGVCSTAMALIHRYPCVVVNTGGNYAEAWKNIHQLQQKRIPIIVLSSFTQGYPTYYDYIASENLKPFYKSCTFKAKQVHLNRLFKAFGPCTVNVGLIAGEEERTESFKSTGSVRYNFPMLSFTREQCEKILRAHGMEPVKTGCWFCGKQPCSSWLWLKENHPEKFEEARQRGWLPSQFEVKSE